MATRLYSFDQNFYITHQDVSSTLNSDNYISSGFPFVENKHHPLLSQTSAYKSVWRFFHLETEFEMYRSLAMWISNSFWPVVYLTPDEILITWSDSCATHHILKCVFSVKQNKQWEELNCLCKCSNDQKLHKNDASQKCLVRWSKIAYFKNFKVTRINWIFE